MNVTVGHGQLAIPSGSGATRFKYFAWVDDTSGYAVTVAAASASNPRVDTIVAYIDKNVTPKNPTNGGTVNNNNAVLKIISVAGTPAASPTAATDTQINTAVTAGNPWIKLAFVTVDTGVTQIAANKVSDARELYVPAGTELARAELTATVSTSNGTPQDVPGLSITFKVPKGGRTIEIEAYAPNVYNNTAAGQCNWIISDLAGNIVQNPAPYVGVNTPSIAQAKRRVPLPGGIFTYKARYYPSVAGGNSMVVGNSATAPATLTATVVS